MLVRLLSWPLQRPRTAWALIALGTALALVPLALGRLRLDFSVRSLIPQRDPRLLAYDRFRADFGPDDDTALVLLETRAALSPEQMARWHTAGEKLRALPRVDAERVASLAHITWIHTAGDELRLAPLFQPEHAADYAPEAVRERLRSQPIYRDRIIAGAGDVVAFLVPLDPLRGDDPRERQAFAQELRAALADLPGAGERLYFDGFIMTREEIRVLMLDDMLRYYPLAAATLLIVLGLLLRSLSAALACAAAVTLAALWTLSFMAVADIPITIISTSAGILIGVAGVGDSVHYVSRLRAGLAAGHPMAQAAAAAVAEVGQACGYTTITTVAGFASLLTSDVPLVRDFGLPVAFGVLMALVLTFAILPPLLVRFPGLVGNSGGHAPPFGRTGGAHAASHPRGRSLPLAPGAVSSFVERAADVILRARWAILAGSALTVALAVWGATRVRVESRMLEDFGPETPLAQTRAFSEERFGGVSALELVLRAPGERVLDIEVLRAVERLETELRGEDFRRAGVLHVLGLPDFLRDIHHVWNQRRPGTDILPDSTAAAAQFLLLYEGASPRDPTADYLAGRRDALRVQVRITNLLTTDFFALAARIDAAARRALPADIARELTGAPLMGQAVHQSLVNNLGQSFALALVAISLSFFALTRSWSLALLALIPNLLPMIWILGLMGALDVPLRIVTSVIFCTTFGIAVDDTIHFLAAWQQRRGRSDAVRAVLVEIGPSLVATTVVLVAGFGVLLFSGIAGNRLFGGLALVTLIFALAGDLLVTPALISLRRESRSAPPAPPADRGA